MIKRLLYLLSALWALAFVLNGATKVNGAGPLDYAIAIAPFVCVQFLVVATRFVLTGDPFPSTPAKPFKGKTFDAPSR
jgi:hypothetical protein